MFSKEKEKPQQSEEAESPSVDYWQMFSDISLKRTYFEEADAYYKIPVFTSDLLDLSETDITLTGYYLPYSDEDTVIILSNFPIASCFFCGKAGIESVVMVELEDPKQTSYKTDQILTVSGKLRLNSTNIKKLAFVIADAKVGQVEN